MSGNHFPCPDAARTRESLRFLDRVEALLAGKERELRAREGDRDERKLLQRVREELIATLRASMQRTLEDHERLEAIPSELAVAMVPFVIAARRDAGAPEAKANQLH